MFEYNLVVHATFIVFCFVFFIPSTNDLLEESVAGEDVF